MNPLVTSYGDEAYNVTTTEENQEIKLIFTLPANLSCSRLLMIIVKFLYFVKRFHHWRCVLEWKYRSELNETHDWEGRHCADISIDLSDNSNKVSNNNDYNDSDEYSNDGLFAIYVDEKDVVVFEDVDKNKKLENNYKQESNESKMEPKAMPYKTDLEISRQMDIPLPEVIYNFCKNNWIHFLLAKPTLMLVWRRD